MNWHLEKIKVSNLKEYPQNPMQHNEKDLGDLEVSINKFGVADPIRINTDFMIIGGHGTKKVLEKYNIKEVDCYLSERKLTKSEFKELNVRLNKNRSQNWDFDLLANNFEIPELLSFGFNEDELGLENKKQKEINPKNVFEIVIECENENQQEQFYNELSTKYKCRLLTL